MLDFQTVQSRQQITPSNIKEVPGVTPTVIEIEGANFDKVSEVRINDIPSPSFMIESTRRILAELPSGVSLVERVRTVELLSFLPVSTEPAKLFFEFGPSPQQVEGIQKLVQLVIKVLLTTPGRDLFNPQLGGGFLQQIGRNISINNAGGLMTDLAVGISRTQSQVVEAQAAEPSIPDDERLLSLELADAIFDAPSNSIFVALRVQSVGGKDAVAKLFL